MILKVWDPVGNGYFLKDKIDTISVSQATKEDMNEYMQVYEGELAASPGRFLFDVFNILGHNKPTDTYLILDLNDPRDGNVSDQYFALKGNVYIMDDTGKTIEKY